jgi:hypothetical protein
MTSSRSRVKIQRQIFPISSVPILREVINTVVRDGIPHCLAD